MASVAGATTRGAVLLLAALAIGLGAAPARAATPDQTQIADALKSWMTAFNTRDAAHVCDLFAPDLVAAVQGSPTRHYDTVCASLRKALANNSRALHYTMAIREIIVSGDLAVVPIAWTLQERVGQGKPRVVSKEIGMDAFQRQPDGKWKISRFVSYEIPANAK
jgi:steroid delta-isomerase